MKFSNGDKVRDSITGFVGIIVCRSDWFNGCQRYSVQGEKMKNGLPTESQHFDEAQLVLVKAGAIKIAPMDRGGPMPAPQRPQNPK